MIKKYKLQTSNLNLKRNIKAFSLIELSIILIIIGLLISSIYGGKSLIRSSRLANARNLTVNSVLNNSELATDVVGWLESVSKSSFNNPTNGSTLSSWNNIGLIKNNLNCIGKSFFTSIPTYTEDAVNGLPSVTFSMTNSSANGFLCNKFGLQNSSFTYFVVDKPNRTTLSGECFRVFHPVDDTINNYRNVYLSYCSQKVLIGYGIPNNGKVNTYSSFANNIPQAKITTVVYDSSTSTIKFYFSHSSTPITSSTPANLTSWETDQFTIGYFVGGTNGNGFDGYISEIIAIKKALSDTERQQVEAYLSRKWKIPVLHN